MKAALLGILLALLAVGSADGEVSTADVLRGCYHESDLGCSWLIRWSADVASLGTADNRAWPTTSLADLSPSGETLCVLKVEVLVAERAEKHRRLTCGQWAAYLRDYVQRHGGASSWAGSVGLCFLYDPVCGGAR